MKKYNIISNLPAIARYVLAITVPSFTFFLGTLLDLLPESSKEQLGGTIESVASFQTLLFLLIVIFALVIITIGGLIYNTFDKEIKRLQDVNSSMEELSRGRTVHVESVNQTFKDDIEIEGIRIKEYYTSVTKFVQRAEKSIIIFDYIANHSTLNKVMESLKENNKKHLIKEINASCQKHFATIEEHFEEKDSENLNTSLQYTRILMLPLINPYSINAQNNKTEEKTLRECINTLTLRHLEKLLACKKQNNRYKGNIHLRILPLPILNYSFGIIDNKKLLLELDFYNLNGDPAPNHLFIIHDNEKGEIINPFKGYYDVFNDKCIDIENTDVLNKTLSSLRKDHINRQKTKIKNKN